MASDIPIKASESLNVLAGAGPPDRVSSIAQNTGMRWTEKVGRPGGSGSVDAVVSGLDGLVQDLRRNLQFAIDDKSGETVIKVIDSETREIVRQIPSEEIMRLQRRLEEAVGRLFQGWSRTRGHGDVG